MAPKNTPKDLVARLNKEMAAAVAGPTELEKLTKLGFETKAATPEEFAAFIKAEIPKWAGIIKMAGIQPR
jgi:tripartite-type tricarboxylate transporter receptor subunit TctC